MQSTVESKLITYGWACTLIAVLSGCIGPRWSTLESNLSSGIVDRYLQTNGMLSSDEKTSSDAVEKHALADLARAGYLASSESLRAYLTQSGMSCAEAEGAVWSCRTSRYRIERLESGGPEDRTYRIDWHVNISWNGNDLPIQPRIIVNRTLQPEPSGRATKQ
jgi:hypothetical protein